MPGGISQKVYRSVGRSTFGNTFGSEADSSEFILFIDTTIISQTASNMVTIPMVGTGTIKWGDGTVSAGVTGIQVHVYAVPGQYVVSMSRSFKSIRYVASNDSNKLLEIRQWGDMLWTTMESSFRSCGNMDITATDLPKSRNSVSMSQSFRSCTSIGELPLIDTSSSINFSNAFRDMKITSFPKLDTSAGTTFFDAWRSCSQLTSFPLLDFTSGANLSNTWRGCTGLTEFPATPFPAMATGAEMFTDVTLDIDSWSALLELNERVNSNNTVTWGGGFSTYNVQGKEARDELTDNRSWTITDGGLVVTPMELLVDTTIVADTASDTIRIPFVGSYSEIEWEPGVFEGAGSGTTDHTYTTGGTYVIKITADSGEIIYANGTNDEDKLLEIQQWGSMVWSTMSNAFQGCGNMSITSTDFPGTRTVSVFLSAFRQCSSLTSVPLIDTRSGASFSAMFRQATNLASIPLFNTSMGSNFSDFLRQTAVATMPLLDTSSGTTFLRMFSNNAALISVPLLDLSLALSVNNMFNGCTGLDGFDLPTFNIPIATNMLEFLQDVAVSTQSYSDLLVALESVNNVLSNDFGGGNSKYNSEGETARNALTGFPRFWTISDGGLEP